MPEFLISTFREWLRLFKPKLQMQSGFLFPIKLLKVVRRLSENALFPKLCVMLKKLSSKYQLYVCGNFLSK
ncbi:MAG: hypothetical protein B1H11_10160 [Desulfobacteraceae bacterium 4484_190.1]|nr:MAG: hypothetical protein B1H11_10160 [Desulfobacteraceae bacterium 4484_190.1]